MTDREVSKIRIHESVRVIVEAEFIGEHHDSSPQVGEPTDYQVYIKGGMHLADAKDIKEVVPDYRRRCFRKHDIVKLEVRPGIFELIICDGETNDGRVMVRGLPKSEWPHYTRVKLVCAEHLRDDRKEVCCG